MESTTLGNSGLRVSRATLGAMNFGPDFGGDETAALRMIDAFLDAGGTTIDTADVYGAGRSEEIVGRAIAARRDEVVLATKGGMPVGAGSGLSRRHLTQALEGSLKRLGTDHVDLYQCHVPDPSTPIEETMATLDGFVRAGKVRYLGCSNMTARGIVEAQWAASRQGGVPFVGLQPHYSLLARDIEAEILPTCARHGLGTLTYGPLASGILGGRCRQDAEPEPGSRIDRLRRFPHDAARRWVDTMLEPRSFEVADRVAAVADACSTTSAAVAVAWVLARPGVSSVIVGPRTPEQLDDLLAGVVLSLSEESVADLDAVSAPTNHPVTGVPAGLLPA